MSQNSFKDFALDQLAGLEGLHYKGMFGGYGLYQDHVFFAIIHQDRLYFKTDKLSRREYIKYKCKPFRPRAKQILKSYYEVPLEILEDQKQILVWAQNAIRAAEGNNLGDRHSPHLR